MQSPSNNIATDTAAAPNGPMTSRVGAAMAAMIRPSPPPPDPTLHAHNCQLADEWLRWLDVSRNRADNTLKAYELTVASWLGFLAGRPLGLVGPAEAEQWLLRPSRHGGPRKPSSVKRDVAVLRSFYGWLEDRGHVHANLGRMVHPPTVHNRLPKPIPDGDFTEAWRSADDDRMRTLLGLMFYCGLRSIEASSLERRHVDVTHEQLAGFVRKGGGDDAVPYGELAQVWAEFLGGLWHPEFVTLLEDGPLPDLGPGDLACGYPTPMAAQRAMRAFRARIGAHWTPHQLRHGFVTNMLRVRMPIEIVSELANHSSIDVTLRYAKRGGGRVREWREAEAVRRPNASQVTQGDAKVTAPHGQVGGASAEGMR